MKYVQEVQLLKTSMVHSEVNIVVQITTLSKIEKDSRQKGVHHIAIYLKRNSFLVGTW